MKIIRQLGFHGKFEKADIEDSEPLEEIDATIYCYANGQVLLEASNDVMDAINEKLFLEAVPIHGISGEQNTFNPDSSINFDAFFELTPNTFDEVSIIRPAYTGRYKIEGKTPEGIILSAIVSKDSRKKPYVILKDLKINYDDTQKISATERVKYGLSKLRLLSSFTASFMDCNDNFYITPIDEEDRESLDATLTAEMVLSNLPYEDDYRLYANWFVLLLSFASGDKTDIIYEIKILQVNNEYKEVEYWSGDNPNAKSSSLLVIQQPELHQFIHKVSKSITPEIFVEKGLALSLFWYLETFSSCILPNNFIFLCTAFETLNKNFSSNSKNKLISTQKYRNIRKSIFEILDQAKNNLNETCDELEQYDIFCKKVKQSFTEGGFNRIGSLSSSLQEMLEVYEVSYKDLFPKLDFISIRNQVIHQGFSDPESMFNCFLRLENLFIRTVLSMLKYEGNYMEHEGTELICRSFPFSDNE